MSCFSCELNPSLAYGGAPAPTTPLIIKSDPSLPSPSNSSGYSASPPTASAGYSSLANLNTNSPQSSSSSGNLFAGSQQLGDLMAELEELQDLSSASPAVIPSCYQQAPSSNQQRVYSQQTGQASGYAVGAYNAYPQQSSFSPQSGGFPQQPSILSQETSHSLPLPIAGQQTNRMSQQTASLPFNSTNHPHFSSTGQYNNFSGLEYGEIIAVPPAGGGEGRPGSSGGGIRYQGFSSLYNELESAMLSAPPTPTQDLSIVEDEDDDIEEIEFVPASSSTSIQQSGGMPRHRAVDEAIIIPSAEISSGWSQQTVWPPLPTADASIVASPQRVATPRGVRGRGRPHAPRGLSQPQVRTGI